MWLIKVQFSASTFVMKIATFAKPQTVAKVLLRIAIKIKKRQKALSYLFYQNPPSKFIFRLVGLNIG
ncbi:MAG: hypothetical protein COS42_11635 [Flavobacteriales bacterium CG03_land_8_20_14_0_80_35_15]|nr:MAG: hypothetical protein COS42_11635 [Flavobacteriales bacterium CG03_land_8_20_14_0_80_35_15]PIX05984.1 MAG: hypothetical protein COZ76_11300 [Flavobacteriales bacterium CG_4_8_14_3_um_filter_35_10]PJA05479.1 MAG: hypothetical protein COX71_06480 [Flavobacteriales bacterium CG_4_10_14_0_2_um_filter_35_18]